MKGLIWLTWRQHRWPIVISAAITVIFFVLMAITASDLGSMAAKCLTETAEQCQRKNTEAVPSHATYLMNSLVFLPVLVAVFWGVPLLAREFEQRTLPLAWSQDVSRGKWLAGKTTVMVVLIAAMGTVLAAESEHLAYQYHAYTSESLFEGTQFQAGGWLPLTLGLAWLAVGIAAGAATRRVLAAIAVVGGLWIVRMVGMVQLRPRFMTAVTVMKPYQLAKRDRSGPPVFTLSNDMGINSGSVPFVDAHGGTHSPMQVMDTWCGSADDMNACLHQHGIVGNLVKFQPAGRMGTFHLIENGMNLGLFVIALAVAWWCVRHTRTTVG
ncbi:ABC transporter permease [Catenulispora pinisilvae]|uniref:ABC transporter permease n=1 Tax=Catenulispora pinisilvae TaxID=2705253 RepID=UPI001890DC9A|nr:ABC transporter permease subunit [Catenulispora pinisilvae]